MRHFYLFSCSLVCWCLLVGRAYANELTVLGDYGSPCRVLSIQPLSAVDTIYINGNIIRTINSTIVVSEKGSDGMGNAAWTILYDGSEPDVNLVSFAETDAFGHVMTTWNSAPIPSEADLSQAVFQAAATDYYSDARPFIEQSYEAGFIRPTELRQAGASYADHPSVYSYGTNTADEVIKWEVSASSVNRMGFREAGTLKKIISTDAEGVWVCVYKDCLDRVVLRRTVDGDTYYVYDDFGRLRYILPPSAVSEMTAGIHTDESEPLRLYGYVYKYDRKGQLIEKRLPGCESVLMEYDQFGRLHYVQDGNQRQRGDYWLCIDYDSYGRIICEKEINRTNASYEKLLKELYYDDYSSLSSFSSGYSNLLAFVPRTGYGERSFNVSGLPTAEVTYSLNSSARRIDVMYYDRMGRCIQKRTSDPTAGFSAQFLSYNFNGTINKCQIEHLDLTEKYTYQYDDLGRLTRTYYKFDGEASVLLSENVYDEVGRVTEYRRNNGQLIRRDSLDIRGNLGRRSDGNFVERLYYADNLPAGITPRYNGLISGSQQKQTGHDLLWKYDYDDSNRLTVARVGTKEDGYSWQEHFSYDAMGNIEHLMRTMEEEPIDDLNYRYRGNQLVDIEDNAGRIDYYNIKEYADLSAADTTMRYDANGNLKYDLDRGISYISYNLLNLPDTVQFSNGNMLIQEYDADGRKTAVHKVVMAQPLMVPVGIIINLHQENYSLRTTYYADNAEIAEPTPGAIEFTFHNAEGYVKYSPNAGSYRMCYYVRDHLGNICAVWDTEDLQYTQRTWYYPSGVPMYISSGQLVQPMKYTGKPYEEMEGFDVFDYGFRGYYATIMRFTSIDPLAEETPWQSPYAYAANNPICNIDWMGLASKGTGGAYTTTDTSKFRDLISYLSEGGSLDDYNWDGWDELSDESEWWICNDYLCFYDNGSAGIITIEPSGSFFMSDINCKVLRTYIGKSNQSNLLDGLKQLSNLTGIGGTIKSGIIEFNKWYWIGANGKLYWRNDINGNYLLERSRVLKNIKLEPRQIAAAKLSTFCGAVSIGLECFEIGYTHKIKPSNGINILAGTSSVLAATILFGTGAGEIITVCVAAYAVMDIGCGWITGQSLSNHLDKRWGSWNF